MNFIDRQAVSEVIVLSYSLGQHLKDKRIAPIIISYINDWIYVNRVNNLG